MRRPIEYFWTSSDGDDYSPAILRAQQATTTAGVCCLEFQPRTYKLLSKVDLYRRTAFVAADAGATAYYHNSTVEAPTLYWTNSASCGIEVHHPTTATGTGTYETDPTADADAFVAQHILFKGPGRTAGRTLHAVNTHRRLYLDGCGFRDWGGDAIHADCDVTSATTLGNFNFSRLSNCSFQSLGRCALWLNGGDVNACTFLGLYADNCGNDIYNKTVSSAAGTVSSNICTVTASGHPFIAGDHIKTSGFSTNTVESAVVISADSTTFTFALTASNGSIGSSGTVTGYAVQYYDSAFINNTYIDCATGASLHSGSGFKANDGKNLYLNCYTEGVSNDEVGPTNICIGGTVSRYELAGFTPGTYFAPGTNGVAKVYPGIEARSGTDSAGAFMSIGGAATNSLLEFHHSDATGVMRLQFEQTSQSDGWYEISDSNSNSLVPLRLSHSANATEGRGQIWLPNGHYLGLLSDRIKQTASTRGSKNIITYTTADASARSIGWSSAAPTTGTWVVGDIIYNTVPTAGGTMGWVCTTAGTPGTWKTFGAIEA
jgi:hypothetical protein